MTDEQYARLDALVRVPSRVNAICDALTTYEQHSIYELSRITEWVLSDLSRGMSVDYVLGWLKNTT